MTLAAGMACENTHPVVAIYSTFLQRAYDQLIHDVALQNLPVLFAIDRAGLVGPDGLALAGRSVELEAPLAGGTLRGTTDSDGLVAFDAARIGPATTDACGGPTATRVTLRLDGATRMGPK